MRSNVSSVPVPLDDKYSWQILRGKDGTHATAWALRAAQVGNTFARNPSCCHSLQRAHPCPPQGCSGWHTESICSVYL